MSSSLVATGTQNYRLQYSGILQEIRDLLHEVSMLPAVAGAISGVGRMPNKKRVIQNTSMRTR